MHCGLFYRLKYPKRRPILKTAVQVPRLRSNVDIEFMGVGDDGYEKVKDIIGHGVFYPVDLFHKTHILDPKPSTMCNEEMMDSWNQLIYSQGER